MKTPNSELVHKGEVQPKTWWLQSKLEIMRTYPGKKLQNGVLTVVTWVFNQKTLKCGPPKIRIAGKRRSLTIRRWTRHADKQEEVWGVTK